MNRRAAALLTGLSLLLLPGCYGDVEAFAVGKAKQDCKRMRRCNRSAYVDNHDEDMATCRSDIEDFYLDRADELERLGWDYEQDAGQECVAVSRELRNDCSDEADEDINRACDDVLFDGF